MNLFDKYFLSARVFPILVFIIPFILISYFIFGFSLDYNLVLGSILVIALIYFIALSNREWGKQLEKRLFLKWGGKPTNILLRESDNKISNIEKRKIKLLLEKHTGYPMPKAKQGEEETEKIDETYELYCKYLRNETRDKNKFPVIFDELTNYGAIRNLLALKKIAISLLSIIVGILTFYSYTKCWNLEEEINICMGIALVSIVAWCCITENRLKIHAFRYAHNLLDSAKHIKK